MIRQAFAALLLVGLALYAPAEAWQIPNTTVVAPVAGAGAQLLLSSTSSAQSGTADHALALGYTGGNFAAPYRTMVFPSAGNLQSLKFSAITTPATGKTWDATIYVNGSAAVGATCQVTAVTATCDWAGTVAVSAGDYGAIFIHPSGAPIDSFLTAAVGFTPTTANDTAVPGAAINTFSTVSSNIIQDFAGSTPGGVLNFKQLAIFPANGAVSRLFVNTVAPGTLGSGKSYAFTALNNNTATALTTTVSETATTNSDTTHSYSVVAGDYFNFQGTPTGSPTASDAVFGIRYVPTTAATYAFISGTNGAGATPSATAARYVSISGSTISATETDVENISYAQSFLSMRVKTNTAPGAAASGKKFTITLRKNGAPTAITCDVVETATTCSVTATVAISDNDFIDYSFTPTGNPSLGSYGIGALATR